MKNKKFSKLFAGILAATLVVTGTLTPATSVEAATRSVTVTTQSQLNKALKNSKVTKITIKTSKGVNLVIPTASYKKKQLIIKAPKAVITNKGNFKKVAINDAKTYTERGNKNSVVIKDTNSLKFVAGKQAKGTKVTVSSDGKKLTIVENGKISSVNVKADTALTYRGNSTNKTPVTVASDGVSLNIQKPATLKVITDVKKITVSADATIKVSDDAKVGNVVVAAAVDVAIEGKAKEAIPVTVNAENAKVSTTTPVKVEANAKADISLSAGAEGSEIKTAEGVTADVSNNTTADVPVTDSKGETTKIEAGKESTPSGDDKPAAGGGGGGGSSSSSTPSTPSTPAVTDLTSMTAVDNEDGNKIILNGMTDAASKAAITLTDKTTNESITNLTIAKDGTEYYIAVSLKHNHTYTLTLALDGYNFKTYEFKRICNETIVNETAATLTQVVKEIKVVPLAAGAATEAGIKAVIESKISPYLSNVESHNITVTGNGEDKYEATITIKKGTKTATVTISEFTTLDPSTDDSKVKLDVANLPIEYASGDSQGDVKNNVKLETTGAQGTTVEWTESSDPNTISLTGVVTRPAVGAGDKDVTLSATVSSGSVTSTASIVLTVKAYEPCDITATISGSAHEVALDAPDVTLTAEVEYASADEKERVTPTYQWYKGTELIDKATNNTYLAKTTTAGTIAYKVKVTNGTKAWTSDAYTLTVNKGDAAKFAEDDFSVPAVTASSVNIGTNCITLSALETNTLPADAKVTYAKNLKNNKPIGAPWQESPTFTNLGAGETWYFFAKVESTNYEPQISTGTAITTKAETPVDPNPGTTPKKPQKPDASAVSMSAIIGENDASIKVETGSGVVATNVSIHVALSVTNGSLDTTGLDESNKGWTNITSNGAAEFTGLEKNKTYYVVIKAVDVNDSSNESDCNYFAIDTTVKVPSDDDKTEAQIVTISAIDAVVSAGSITVTAATPSGLLADDNGIKVALTTSNSIAADAITEWETFDPNGKGTVISIKNDGTTYYVAAKVVSGSAASDITFSAATYKAYDTVELSFDEAEVVIDTTEIAGYTPQTATNAPAGVTYAYKNSSDAEIEWGADTVTAGGVYTCVAKEYIDETNKKVYTTASYTIKVNKIIDGAKLEVSGNVCTASAITDDTFTYTFYASTEADKTIDNITAATAVDTGLVVGNVLTLTGNTYDNNYIYCLISGTGYTPVLVKTDAKVTYEELNA